MDWYGDINRVFAEEVFNKFGVHSSEVYGFAEKWSYQAIRRILMRAGILIHRCAIEQCNFEVLSSSGRESVLVSDGHGLLLRGEGGSIQVIGSGGESASVNGLSELRGLVQEITADGSPSAGRNSPIANGSCVPTAHNRARRMNHGKKGGAAALGDNSEYDKPTKEDASGWPEDLFVLTFFPAPSVGRCDNFLAVVFRLLKSEWNRMIVILVVLSAGTASTFLGSIFIADLIDRAGMGYELPWGEVGFVGVVIFAARIFHVAGVWTSSRVVARLRVKLIVTFVLRVVNARPGGIDSVGTGDLLTRLGDLLSVLERSVALIVKSLSSLSVLIGGGVFLFAVEPKIVTPMAVAFALLIVIVIALAPRFFNLKRVRLVLLGDLRQNLIERLEHRFEMQHLDPRGWQVQRFDRPMAKWFRTSQIVVEVGGGLTVFAAFVGAVANAFTIWGASTYYKQGEATLGVLVAVLGIVAVMWRAGMEVVNIIPQCAELKPSLDRANDFLAVTEAEVFKSSPTIERSCPFGVVLREVGYLWPSGRPALDSVSIEIPASSWSAIVGASGSGKTTLARVLSGELPLTCGEIEVNGFRVKPGDQGLLREFVTVVDQELFLLNRSLRENILYGASGVSEEELNVVVKDVGLDDYVRAVPRGLDEPVGDNGAAMSIGEMSRVAIARAILKRPRLLVLDEALAKLDVVMEKRVVQAIRATGASVLLLTHDLHQALAADYIHVLQDGRIIESGKAEKVLAQAGAFRRFAGAKETRGN